MLHSPGIDRLLQPRTDGRPIPGFTPVFRCDILSQGVPVATDVPCVGQPIQQTRSQLIRRSANSITILDPALVPDGGLADVIRLGNEVRVYRGVGRPLSSPELLPQITGGIARADVAYDNGRPAGVTVQIADRMRALSKARFLNARRLSGGSAKDMLRTLLLVAPWWSVRFDPAVDDVPVTAQTFARERGDAVTYLAASLAAEVFSDGLGEFVVQPIPSVTGTPDFQVYGGEGGNLLTGARSISDDGVYNGIVATGQSAASGTPPTSDPALDLDPTSDTVWDGPYLEVPGFFDSPLIVNKTQANLAAQAQLRNAVGAARSVTFTVTPHPGLEVGDLVGVTFPDGTYEQHLIDSLSMPLDETSPIQASTRASRDVAGVS